MDMFACAGGLTLGNHRGQTDQRRRSGGGRRPRTRLGDPRWALDSAHGVPSGNVAAGEVVAVSSAGGGRGLSVAREVHHRRRLMLQTR